MRIVTKKNSILTHHVPSLVYAVRLARQNNAATPPSLFDHIWVELLDRLGGVVGFFFNSVGILFCLCQINYMNLLVQVLRVNYKTLHIMVHNCLYAGVYLLVTITICLC